MGAPLEGAETHRALHCVHRARQRMQRFSAMYTLPKGRHGKYIEMGSFCACMITASPQII